MVEQHLPAERDADRQRPGLCRLLEREHRRLAPARAPDDGEGPLCRTEQVFQLAHLDIARPRFDLRPCERRGRFRAIGQHVLGQGDHHRSRPAGGGNREGTRDEFRDARRVVDLDRPFRDAAEKALVVDLLPGLALLDAARDLADEQDHRRGILHGDVDAGRRIGGARTARDEANAGPAGKLALAIGHHRRSAFLAADDGADRRIVQRIEHRQIGFSGHAEDTLDAVCFERVDDQLSAGFHSSCFSSSARISAVCSPSRGEGR